MEKFTMAGGTALHYTDSECGERPVLLLHGYLESLDIWDEFGSLLRRSGFRVLTLDLPGHGISEVLGQIHTMEFLANKAINLLDKIGIAKCRVVGHSMGGYVALAMAAKYPERLSSIVLFHSTPNADSPEKIENRMREIEIVESGRKELLSKTFPERCFAKENRKKFADIIESLSLQVMLTEDEGITALLRGMIAREDMNAMLHELKIPQLFIFGRHDELLTPETAGTIIRNNPQAAVRWLENSGHMGFIEEPVESLKILTDPALY